MKAPRVLVTGASGFIGGAVVKRLQREPGFITRAACRHRISGPTDGFDLVVVGDLGPATDWGLALHDCTTVVHASARVHVMRDAAADPLAAFRTVNVAGTLHLAREAARMGVRRFIFLSSIKVNGEETPADRPFTADDVPAPRDPYGMSKLEAEAGLRELAEETGLEVVIVRPVLVYGPGVKANFRAMMRALQRGIPLPFGAIHNRRSLVALDNLVDLLVRCLTHPAAAGRTFLVSDGEDLSTTELLFRTAKAMGKKARLLPVPSAAIEITATLLGRGEMASRLCRSLTVDITKNRELLGWTPPVNMDEALATTAADFLQRAR